MNILQIAKLSGGIREHIKQIEKHSENSFFFLDYRKAHAIPIPIVRAKTFLLFGIPAGLNQIRKNKISLIHAHYILPAGLLGVMLSKLTGKKLVLTVHGSDIVRLPLLNFLKKFVLANSQIITTSKYLRDEVRKLGFDSRLIPNAVDHKTISRATPKALKHPAVVFIGALNRNKAAFLKQITASPYNFYIIGSGPLKNKFNGNFLGELPSADVYAHLKAADVFISTSSREGFGLAVLEAMACKTPVVARPNSGVQELIGDNRGLPADSPSQFISSIQKLLADKDLRASLTTRAYGFSRKFSWSKTAKETDDVYSRLQKSR